jgi:hypothetical protein
VKKSGHNMIMPKSKIFAQVFVEMFVFAKIFVFMKIFASIFVFAKIFASIFAKIFVYFRMIFSRKTKINVREIFAKIRKRKFSFQP